MKKIMFNDKYGLTKAVLEGRKTQSRRFITLNANQYVRVVALDNGSFFSYVAQKGKHSAFMGDQELPEYDGQLSPAYFIGEEVAVAQSYKDAGISADAYVLVKWVRNPDGSWDDGYKKAKFFKGWSNKMFVKANLMPHRIKITNIRIERLQDISDADCLKEGIFEMPYRPPFVLNHEAKGYAIDYDTVFNFKHGQRFLAFTKPKEAFAYLIDKVFGKGTWESNPYVFVYEFELVK